MSAATGGGPAPPEELDPRKLRGSISHLLTPDELRAKGKESFQEGDNEKAVFWFNRLLCVDPTCNTVHSNLSAAHGAMGNWDTALVHAKASVSLQPNWIKAHYRLGMAHFKIGNLKEARDALERGLQLNYNSQEVHRLLKDVNLALRVHWDEKERWRQEDAERAHARAAALRAEEAEAVAHAAERAGGDLESDQRRREEAGRVRGSARLGRERVEWAAMERERQGRERTSSRGARTARTPRGKTGSSSARRSSSAEPALMAAAAPEGPDDPYEVLGIEDPEAPDDEVKAAYRRALLRAHPDKGGRPGDFERVQAAHAVLSDPALRAAHDEARGGGDRAGHVGGGVRHHGQSGGAATGAARAESVAEQLRAWGLEESGASGGRGDWQARKARSLNSRIRGENAARAGEHGSAVRCFTEALKLMAGAGEGGGATPWELTEILERRARSHAAVGAVEAAAADEDEAEALRKDCEGEPGGAGRPAPRTRMPTGDGESGSDDESD